MTNEELETELSKLYKRKCETERGSDKYKQIQQEYIAMAKEVDSSDLEQSAIYSSWEDGFNVIIKGCLDNLTTDEKLHYAEVLLSAKLYKDQTRSNMYIAHLSFTNFGAIADVSDEQAKKIDNIIKKAKDCYGADNIGQLNLLKNLANTGGLSDETRKLVNSVVPGRMLDAKFQTKRTFNDVLISGYYPKIKETLDYVISSQNAGEKYCKFLGVTDGRIPETKTEMFDACVETINGNEHLEKLKASFVVQDILEGKSDKLTPESIVVLLNTDKSLVHTPSILKKIGVDKAREVRKSLEKSLGIYGGSRQDTSQRLMIINMELRNNPDEEYAMKLSRAAMSCVTSYRDGCGSAALIKETIKNVEAVKSRIEASSERNEAFISDCEQRLKKIKKIHEKKTDKDNESLSGLKAVQSQLNQGENPPKTDKEKNVVALSNYAKRRKAALRR